MSLKSYLEWRETHKTHFLEEVREILDEEREVNWVEQPVSESEVPSYNLTEDGWCEIKGIGPKLAKRLVENGPYSCIEDVAKVKGIKQGVLDCIKQFLFVSPIPQKSDNPSENVESP